MKKLTIGFLSVFLGLSLTQCEDDMETVIAVTGVTLNQTAIFLEKGSTRQLSATVLPANALITEVTWSSGNSAVATVSDTGLVTAMAVGSTTITVTTVDGGKQVTCTVTVAEAIIAVTQVTVDPVSVSLFIGHTQPLTVTVLPDHATFKDVHWSSSHEAIATVSPTGVVTAKAVGTATVVATSVEGAKTGSCTVTVQGVSQLGDGDWCAYLSHTAGPGINLVFMGDGYTASDISKGKYETDMANAIHGFFAIEPYKTYKPYFNAYIVGAVSNESGIGTGGVPKDTKFKAYHGDGTEMNAVNKWDCITYAKMIPGVDEYKSAIALITNSTKYGGVNWFTYSTIIPNRTYQVAICPSDNELISIIQHELGGHGFGQLGDEYWDNGSGSILDDEERWQRAADLQGLGYHLNVSVTNDPSKVYWKDFLGKTKYTTVGFYEGAYLFEKDVWRSEDHSCMRYNDPYYNAISRMIIVKRIKELAGEPFSIEWFQESDIFSIYTRSYDSETARRRQLPPLAPPVMIGIE